MRISTCGQQTSKRRKFVPNEFKGFIPAVRPRASVRRTYSTGSTGKASISSDRLLVGPPDTTAVHTTYLSSDPFTGFARPFRFPSGVLCLTPLCREQGAWVRTSHNRLDLDIANWLNFLQFSFPWLFSLCRLLASTPTSSVSPRFKSQHSSQERRTWYKDLLPRSKHGVHSTDPPLSVRNPPEGGSHNHGEPYLHYPSVQRLTVEIIRAK